MTRVAALVAAIAIAAAAVGDDAGAQTARAGAPPAGPWVCPATHPIKGYLSQSGALVYFVPAHPFYDEASPEWCYGSEDEARSDGAGPARGWANNYPLV
ncbi:MAG: hypothetical protein HYU41_28290 [Candidatus Rokubacteria bacterium]|nr:hypothetical protein [Candidatus Rokubacteria bacterium]